MDMNSIVDNKLNMSLDDIIKKERIANKRLQNDGFRRGAGTRTLMKRNIKNNQSVSTRTITRKNRRQGATSGRNVASAAAMKVVNKLVKRAIERRANQSLINRAATLRRRALQRNTAVRPGGRVLRVRKEVSGAGSRLAGRLSGINRRSRVIRRDNMRVQPVVFASPQVLRGRGISRMGQLASDSEAVIVGESAIGPSVLKQQVMRRVSTLPQNRQVILRRPTNPVYLEERPVVIRRGGRQKRIALRNAPSVVYVEPEPQFTPQHRYGHFANGQSNNRSGGKNRYVINPNAIQMRKALGIGMRQSEPQRFETSSTFLQRVPVTSRRGRGFREIVYN
ncbi:unnamed protein product [Thelazia callipaeda]|uniref:Forty-two-three domain-containing protein 1 n=1 Tax=Thelazia callipaeda TaxID=103827 RepID=A0A0N5D1S2_THECL|nr:unnamed protein product [Thelazia callipaeda]